MTVTEFGGLSPTTLADCLPRSQVMDPGIKALWQPMPRLVGAAYTAACPPGDHLMLHAAIQRAPAGSVIVVESGDCDYALAGGNVCAVAQKRGIAGFVLDGAIRDVAEIRALGFAVFCRAVMPKPGAKDALGPLNAVVRCGGVRVAPGDFIVGDEEGIVVVPRAEATAILVAAQKRAAADAAQTLAAWEEDHRRRIGAILAAKGFQDQP
jgi:regulator of RNase E activity RraA